MVNDRAAGARFIVDADQGKRRLVDALWSWFTRAERPAVDQAFDAFWVSELPIQIKRMPHDLVWGLPAIAKRWRKTWLALAAQANALAARLDWDAALAWWQMAAFLAEARGPEAQADMAYALRLSGDAARTLGRSRDALQAFEASLAVGKMLVGCNSASLQTRRDLALSYTRIGDVILDQNDRDGAFAAYQQSLEIMRTLSDAQPNDTQWMREVAFYLEKIGTVHALSLDWADALRAFRKGLTIRRKLCRRDKDNTQWRHDLSVSLGKIGDALFDQQYLSGALKAYQEALAIVSSSLRRGAGQCLMAACPTIDQEQNRRCATGRRPDRGSCGDLQRKPRVDSRVGRSSSEQ